MSIDSNLIQDFNELHLKLLYNEFLIKLNDNNKKFHIQDFNFLKHNFHIFNQYLFQENKTHNTIQFSQLSLLLYKPHYIQNLKINFNNTSNIIINLNDYFQTINNSYLKYNIVETNYHFIHNNHLILTNNYNQTLYNITIKTQEPTYELYIYQNIQINEYILDNITPIYSNINIKLGYINNNLSNLNILTLFNYEQINDIKLISSNTNPKYILDTNHNLTIQENYNDNDNYDFITFFIYLQYSNIDKTYINNFIQFNITTSPNTVTTTSNITNLTNIITTINLPSKIKNHFIDNKDYQNAYTPNNNTFNLNPDFRGTTYIITFQLEHNYILSNLYKYKITEESHPRPRITDYRLLLKTFIFNDNEKSYNIQNLFTDEYDNNLTYTASINKIIRHNDYFDFNTLNINNIDNDNYFKIINHNLIIKPNYRNIIYKIHINAKNKYNQTSDRPQEVFIIENRLINIKVKSFIHSLDKNQDKTIHLKDYYSLNNYKYYYISYQNDNQYYYNLDNHYYTIYPKYRNKQYTINFTIIYNDPSTQQYDTANFNIIINETYLPTINIDYSTINIFNLKNTQIICNLENYYNYELDNHIEYHILNNYNSNHIRLNNNHIFINPDFRNIKYNIDIQIIDKIYDNSNIITFYIHELHPINIINYTSNYQLDFKLLHIDVDTIFNNNNNSHNQYTINNNYSNISFNNNIIQITPLYQNTTYNININAIDRKYPQCNLSFTLYIYDNILPTIKPLISKIKINLYKYEFYDYQMKYNLNNLINYPDYRKNITYIILYNQQFAINTQYISISNNNLIVNTTDISLFNQFNDYTIQIKDNENLIDDYIDITFYNQIFTEKINNGNYTLDLTTYIDKYNDYDYKLYIDNNFVGSNLIYKIQYYNNLNYTIYISILYSNIEYDSLFIKIQEPSPFIIINNHLDIHYNLTPIYLNNYIQIHDISNLTQQNIKFNIDYYYNSNYYTITCNINTIENSNIYYIPQSNILLSNNNLIINTSNIITPNNEFGIKIHINIDNSNYTFENYLYFNIKY